MKLDDIYIEFITINPYSFGRQNLLAKHFRHDKAFKSEILKMLEYSIAQQEQDRLAFCLAAALSDGIDFNYTESIEQVILQTWHAEHEDIVELVRDLKNEKFVEPLLQIAFDGPTYRKFDDELEATLRKCVHALIEINTEKSRQGLARLMNTQNPNVKSVLEMYE